MKSESQEKKSSRVRKFIIFPLMAITFLMAFIIPNMITVSILYFIMASLGLVAFAVPRYSEEVIGINKRWGMSFLIGIGTTAGFFILSKLLPGFSILLPTTPYSVSSTIRGFVVLGIAPFTEEVFRSAFIGLLKGIYKPKRFFGINITQATEFAGLHVFVYGVILDSYESFIEVFGATKAILGSLLAAFLFGLISGYIMEKTKDMKASIIAHFLINLILFSSAFVVVSAMILPMIFKLISVLF